MGNYSVKTFSELFKPVLRKSPCQLIGNLIFVLTSVTATDKQSERFALPMELAYL